MYRTPESLEDSAMARTLYLDDLIAHAFTCSCQQVCIAMWCLKDAIAILITLARDGKQNAAGMLYNWGKANPCTRK